MISQDSDSVADLSGLEQWFFKSWAVAKIIRKKKSVTFMYNGQIGLLSMFYFSTVLRDPLA